MGKVTWGDPGTKLFETGLDQGVLYPQTGLGVGWSGLVSVDETVDGGEAESLYFDGIKYHDFIAADFFAANIEVISVPPEFGPCEGIKTLSPGLTATNQPRKTFGLCYRTLLGNDLVLDNLGHKLHVVYGATAIPTSKKYQTKTANTEVGARQISIKTVPPSASTYKPTAHFVLDSTKIDEFILAAIEEILYGVDGGDDPRLPSQAELIAILS